MSYDGTITVGGNVSFGFQGNYRFLPHAGAGSPYPMPRPLPVT
jgi:hypothetical protein